MTLHALGRYQVAEPPSNLASLHFHAEGTPLKEVDWMPPCAILDQEDLVEQGIRVSTFIPGAPAGVNALGSCTANTFLEWGSLQGIEFFTALVTALLELVSLALPTYAQPSDLLQDTKTIEIAAIVFYHVCTDQTGEPAQEWPPTDCGSTGLYVYDQGVKLGYVTSEKIAHGALNIVSLMQTGPLLTGIPYLNAWMEPSATDNYCIDGDGSTKTLKEQIAEGVAGGHELLMAQICQLGLLRSGELDPFSTIIEFPNHWDPQWADHGRARVHLSTLAALGSAADFRQFAANTQPQQEA